MMRGTTSAIRRVLALSAVAFIALLVSPGVSHAEPYPAPPGATTVSPAAVSPGGVVTFGSRGFLAGEDIGVGLRCADGTAGQVATVTADPTGAFSTEVRIDCGPGSAVLSAYGTRSNVLAEATVQVLAPARRDAGGAAGGGAAGDTGGSGLPVTGNPWIDNALYLGVGLLAVGLVVVGSTFLIRRRSSGAPA